MTGNQIGFAFRHSVFSPREVIGAVQLLDHSDQPHHIFIPDGRNSYESIEMVSAILGQTSQVHAGSGVIRLLEHEPMLLARRLQTIQAFSSSRFFLGVGTGSSGPNPTTIIDSMLTRLDEVKRNLQRLPWPTDQPNIWIAALRRGIARRVMTNAKGLILNFCSPQHVIRVAEGLGGKRPETLQLACYLKLFYSSKTDDTAKRLLVQEFLNYDSIPQYHEMFIEDGTAKALFPFKESNGWRSHDFEVPKELAKVSLANPNDDELRQYVGSFAGAGLDLPVIYPYFSEDEREGFKLQIVKDVLDTVG